MKDATRFALKVALHFARNMDDIWERYDFPNWCCCTAGEAVVALTGRTDFQSAEREGSYARLSKLLREYDLFDLTFQILTDLTSLMVDEREDKIRYALSLPRDMRKGRSWINARHGYAAAIAFLAMNLFGSDQMKRDLARIFNDKYGIWDSDDEDISEVIWNEFKESEGAADLLLQTRRLVESAAAADFNSTIDPWVWLAEQKKDTP